MLEIQAVRVLVRRLARLWHACGMRVSSVGIALVVNSPAVEAAMVGCLAVHVEEDVFLHDGARSEAVVEIDLIHNNTGISDDSSSQAVALSLSSLSLSLSLSLSQSQ